MAEMVAPSWLNMQYFAVEIGNVYNMRKSEIIVTKILSNKHAGTEKYKLVINKNTFMYVYNAQRVLLNLLNVQTSY